MKYCWLSFLSGSVWGGVAVLLSFGAFGWLIIGGVVAAPFIGLLIGLLYFPVYRLPKVIQAFASLVTLYLAAALFGLSIGVFDAFWRDIPDRIASAVILQAMLATVWGLTFLGYFVLLWPLAFFNHRILGSISIFHNKE